MGKRGLRGSNARFMEQLMFWAAMQNLGLGILREEGYELGRGIAGGTGIDRWPSEIFKCGVCELPKPTGVHITTLL